MSIQPQPVQAVGVVAQQLAQRPWLQAERVDLLSRALEAQDCWALLLG